ncbi:MAG TPA: riboflavin synthase [Gammaproteobacteria bacterium]|nr:riboflavin synthase [Gammaproteobacteria bacterium]
MFTGIIQSVGSIQALKPQEGDQRLTVATGKLDMGDVALGDSIAVNGVCLTVIEFDQQSFQADVSNETLDCTTLGDLATGSAVNLEKALLPTTRLGGHLVSGHVDGVGMIIDRQPDARSIRLTIRVPEDISRYIAAKGSICVEGISLTVNRIEGRHFSLNIVPHTLEETNLRDAEVGRRVNLEVDIIARYLEQLLTGARDSAAGEGVTRTLLAESGFLSGLKNA